MRLANVLLLAAAISLIAGAAVASTATSSFDNYVYSYTVTPEQGEDLRSFHVYTAGFECDVTHYYDLVMPAGWSFTTVAKDDICVLTFWTEGDPLPADQITEFGFLHYCAPCCHSWYVSDEGTSDPNVNVVDDDSQHTEPCNIPAEFADQCGGPGLLLAPIYPQSVGDDDANWGSIKSDYR